VRYAYQVANPIPLCLSRSLCPSLTSGEVSLTVMLLLYCGGFFMMPMDRRGMFEDRVLP
jgi:hypothetical protein